jgi:hypothetical protein
MPRPHMAQELSEQNNPQSAKYSPIANPIIQLV